MLVEQGLEVGARGHVRRQRGERRDVEQIVAVCEEQVRRARPVGRRRCIVVERGAIRSITTLSGKTYAGKVFFDATYEGDLLAAAGVGNYARKSEMVDETGIFFVWSGHPTN